MENRIGQDFFMIQTQENRKAALDKAVIRHGRNGFGQQALFPELSETLDNRPDTAFINGGCVIHDR